ncbi:hypothetical protein BJ912DRAFT_159723 [Pholiota molesta]|nr:hypothetical protein BJ912DRAFT_159723 [Pholiota molesta]
MPDYVRDIDSKRVFKCPSSKVASARNILSQCTYPECAKWEKTGGDKFPVCASCKHSRYCIRAHQVQDWARHKNECTGFQVTDGILNIQATSNKLTKDQIIANLLEDFIQLHESTFYKIFNYAYHARLTGTGVDMSRICARANLRYHTDCEQNPGRAFHFRNLEITEFNPQELPRSVLKYRDDFKANRQNDPSFINCIRCVYRIDVLGAQQSAWCPIYKETIPERITHDWYRNILKCLEGGIVLRKIKSRKQKKMIWAPGVMVRYGSRWIWRERTEEQIRAAGVQIPTIETWARKKKTGIVYLDGPGKIPWVAPKEYSWEDEM